MIELFPVLAKQLGQEFFNEKLRDICVEMLQDKIYSVREAAVENIKQLTIIFGSEWAESNITT